MSGGHSIRTDSSELVFDSFLYLKNTLCASWGLTEIMGRGLGGEGLWRIVRSHLHNYDRPFIIMKVAGLSGQRGGGGYCFRGFY